MSTRFDLEQQILDCWNITGDIRLVYEKLMDERLSDDQIANILLGLAELYELKFNKTFRTFETLIHQQTLT